MDKGNKKSKSGLFHLAKVLIDKGAEIEVQFLWKSIEISVNIPSILDYLLCKSKRSRIRELLHEIRSCFREKYLNMGFYDLMLQYSPSVVSYMIDNSECIKEFKEFLNDYKDGSGQTVLHSAAKCFEPSLVERLMKSKLWYVHFIYQSN